MLKAASLEKNKAKVFNVIQIGKRDDLLSRAFDYFIVVVIAVNILCMFLETFDAMAPYMAIIEALESFTVAVFCVEYALRIWTAGLLYDNLGKREAALRFLRSYDGIVDLLTILPFFYLKGFVAFRMLRVVRIFHLFRINASYDSFNVITSVLYEKKNQLLSSLFIIGVLVLASSLCMYSAEHDAQPEAFRNALSGIWWSVSALLTVGYGDIYPVTILGRAMAIVISFLGVMAVAVPTGIISAGFVENYQEALEDSQPVGIGISMVTIGMDSAWLGLSPQEVRVKYRMAVVLVRRNGANCLANDIPMIELGDQVAVYQEDAGKH